MDSDERPPFEFVCVKLETPEEKETCEDSLDLNRDLHDRSAGDVHIKGEYSYGAEDTSSQPSESGSIINNTVSERENVNSFLYTSESADQPSSCMISKVYREFGETRGYEEDEKKSCEEGGEIAVKEQAFEGPGVSMTIPVNLSSFSLEQHKELSTTSVIPNPVDSSSKSPKVKKKYPRKSSGDKYICQHCAKAFAHQSNLIVHVRLHTGEKPYLCQECGKAFSETGKLRNHSRTHSGEKPFPCMQCEKRFSERSHVKVHMRTHTGETPYSCAFCSKSFSTPNNLRVHTRIHTGEKPFTCQHCMKAFSTGSSLNRHLKKVFNITASAIEGD